MDWRRIAARIARITGRPERAEDLLHSAFLRMEEYRVHTQVAQPEAFLVKVAMNIARDEGRHTQIRAELPCSVYDLIDLPDDRPLQDEVAQVRERLERVSKGLDKLSPRTREIFLMHRIDGMKYREIAEEAGITVSAVEKHIAKAVLFLADWAEGW
ncbi:RNA polymerase subunit sigma-24 [Croceicoccus estronivorus]|uniref:sigma-70 family RNA polymerase sigma factor n=1 Tax=Croceicoccus estronivorus TaxID=1172626 RepID=UPI000834A9CE|nr:sigma-70 family RNA polymerase sigma factor [Croceicoccus estronivorus]OCC23367.1 RNA polymerase subunit sigma-24 [Croceicoccus estronivorus]